MVRREAASVRCGHPWPPLRSAGMLLTFLAMALVTTLSGNLGIQATLGPALVPAGAVLSASGDAACAANEHQHSSWCPVGGPVSHGRTLWGHAAKVKRAAARPGQRGSRLPLATVPDRASLVLEPPALGRAPHPNPDQRTGSRRNDSGNPRRGPPGAAD